MLYKDLKCKVFEVSCGGCVRTCFEKVKNYWLVFELGKHKIGLVDKYCKLCSDSCALRLIPAGPWVMMSVFGT